MFLINICLLMFYLYQDPFDDEGIGVMVIYDIVVLKKLECKCV